MTSQGSGTRTFQRAIQGRNLLPAETVARELGSLSLADALALCLLYEGEGDTRFDEHFGAGSAVSARSTRLSHEEVELLRAADGALRSSFREVGLEALVRACAQLGLPRLTLPVARENSRAAARKPMRSI